MANTDNTSSKNLENIKEFNAEKERLEKLTNSKILEEQKLSDREYINQLMRTCNAKKSIMTTLKSEIKAIYKDIADSSRPEQTDRFAEKENTLSLGSLNISYEFSHNICKRIKLRNLHMGVNFTDILRLSTVKIERGTDYLYSQGCEFYLNVTL